MTSLKCTLYKVYFKRLKVYFNFVYDYAPKSIRKKYIGNVLKMNMVAKCGCTLMEMK